MPGFNKRKEPYQHYVDTPEDIAAKESIRKSKILKEETLDEEIERKRKMLETYDAEMEKDRRLIKKNEKTISPIKIDLVEKSNYEKLRSLIITITVLALFIFTNPSAETHQEALKEFVYSETEESLTEFYKGLGLDEKTSLEWSSLITPVSLNLYVPQMIKRKNFILFSQTVLKWNGNKKIIGFGILGNVVLYNDQNNFVNKSKIWFFNLGRNF